MVFPTVGPLVEKRDLGAGLTGARPLSPPPPPLNRHYDMALMESPNELDGTTAAGEQHPGTLAGSCAPRANGNPVELRAHAIGSVDSSDDSEVEDVAAAAQATATETGSSGVEQAPAPGPEDEGADDVDVPCDLPPADGASTKPETAAAAAAGAALNVNAKEFVPLRAVKSLPYDAQPYTPLPDAAKEPPVTVQLAAFYDNNGRYLYTAPYLQASSDAQEQQQQMNAYGSKYVGSGFYGADGSFYPRSSAAPGGQGSWQGYPQGVDQSYAEAAVATLCDQFPSYTYEQLLATFSEQVGSLPTHMHTEYKSCNNPSVQSYQIFGLSTP